ncbi:SLAM family member 5-like [Odontesthes bonariensis]|uniref:SLAM family member 5-like n=1 Tax=Odontesthes bonariensis TaxID=219752 RepID=UPI003F586B0E
MVGGCLSRLSCFFAYGVGLLLVVCIQDAEASTGKRVVHKRVGDTEEFSSNLPTEGVTAATWKYGSTVVADHDRGVSKKELFQSRLEFNPTNFSLTLRDLTVGDSGDFSFLSEANDRQRPTVTITLQVHEPITEHPVLTYSSYQALNGSCVVSLKCSSATHSNVTWSWAVGNHTYSGSELQHTIRPEDGGTTFTCTASNFVSEKSASKAVTCSNKYTDKGEFRSVLILSVAGACLMAILVLTCVVVRICCCKKRHEGSDSNDLTVYADISDVAVESRTPSTLKPCSLYETIENCTGSDAPITPAPQTVYDRIQLSRLRKASVSPYQEVS